MAKKTILEKEIKKRIHPVVIFVFVLFLIIGIVLGYYVKNELMKKVDNNINTFYVMNPIVINDLETVHK